MSTHAVRVPAAPVVLSTASVYPENTASAFEFARRLGYDGIEIMVWNDPISQDPGALERLSHRYDMPVVAIHAPCLVITQRVWGMEPWGKLRRAKEVAEALGASTVVVHPPFRWQTDYARTFGNGLKRLGQDTHVQFAVENMFPLRVRGREVSTYAPHWVDLEHPRLTLDVSHASVARADVMGLYEEMGDRLAHVHIGDGTGLGKDEHLVPGRGTQPCGELLERLARDRFAGAVVVEINSRRAANRERREEDLAESLAFTRLYLAAPSEPGRSDAIQAAPGAGWSDERHGDAQDGDQRR